MQLRKDKGTPNLFSAKVVVAYRLAGASLSCISMRCAIQRLFGSDVDGAFKGSDSDVKWSVEMACAGSYYPILLFGLTAQAPGAAHALLNEIRWRIPSSSEGPSEASSCTQPVAPGCAGPPRWGLKGLLPHLPLF